MKRTTSVSILVICAAGIAAVLLSSCTAAVHGNKDDKKKVAPPYNPYPPGILPGDLNSEIERVLREVDLVESRALARWHALAPPILKGQPPTLQNTGTEAIETLGELMNFDRNMSPNRNQACMSCHMPYAGFGGPIPSVNLTIIAYPGTAHFRVGKRTPQRHPYAPFFPVLQYNQTQGLFFGGNFYDSRATGVLLRNPDAEQAQGPPVDTQEMGFPDTACVAFRLTTAAYRPLFELVWGAGSLDIKFPRNTEAICDTPGGASTFHGSTTPIELAPEDRTKANAAYGHWGQSIDSYEQSLQVSAFSSKFDAFLAGKYKLTADEMAGFELFNGKGKCNSCHLDGRGTTLKPNQHDTSSAATVNPVFTCFGSANEGLPRNPVIPFYYETQADAFQYTPNPAGFGFDDLGMGLFLRNLSGINPNSDWIQYAPSVDGQMQVSSARNAAMTPPNCPTFQKAFFHNGYVKSLKELVHFYNTRDVLAHPVQSGHCPPGTVEKVTCWPEPEVKNNIDMTTGRLGLSDREEDLIVIFLGTLTDGFTTPYPDADKYTGDCLSPAALSPPPPPASAAPFPPGLTPPPL